LLRQEKLLSLGLGAVRGAIMVWELGVSGIQGNSKNILGTQMKTGRIVRIAAVMGPWGEIKAVGD
jgi:hypothetical protein